MTAPSWRRPVAVVLCAVALAGCAAPASDVPVPAAVAVASPSAGPEAARPTGESTPPPPTSPPSSPPAPDDAETVPSAANPRPAWLGTRVLEPGPNGYAAAQDTPPELLDRRLVTPDVLPPPSGDAFESSVQAVSPEVAARSTWSEGCPVALEELRYVTVSFWGFDERPHTGELLVHASAAEALAGVFARLYEARFPIEEMRVIGVDERDAPPTGDGNVTTGFVCRATRGSGSWSRHAFGLAVDVNPFHNPYLKGEVVLPELATAYTDRGWDRTGMVQPGDVVTQAFAAIGWSWGGDWRSLKDWMHFSDDGR